MLSFRHQRYKDNLELLSALAMTMILQVTGLLVFAFRLFGEANSRMSCIERLYKFTEGLHQEHLPRRRMSNSIHQKRSIDVQHETRKAVYALEFRKATLKYDKTPALREISFKISQGERIGVVGRTGSGKSS